MSAPLLAAELAHEPAPDAFAHVEGAAAPAVTVRSGPVRSEPRRSGKLLPVSIALSAALHVAAAAAMLNSSSSAPDFGVLDHPSETLSLALTQTVVLESIVTEPATTASAAAAALPQGTIQSIDAEPTPLTKAEEVEEETISPPPLRA